MSEDCRMAGARLGEMAELMELKGENPFKVRAYQNAARLLESADLDLKALALEDRLTEIKGVGQGLADKIKEFLTTGNIADHEALKLEFPAGVVEMLKVPGLGAKKVKLLHDALAINNVGELEYACTENRLLTLKGFGEKSQKKILDGIALFRRHAGRSLLSHALEAALPLLEAIRRNKVVYQAELAGSLRRRRETVGDIDILVSTDEAPRVMEFVTRLADVESVIGSGETKTSIRLKSGMQVDVRAVKPIEFPFALHYFTGSKEHNVAIRSRAQAQGLKLNEYGLTRSADGTPLRCLSEADIFKVLGLDDIPPELREDTGEIEAALNHSLPKLVSADAIRGSIHNHTDWSDGIATLEEMVAAAKRIGWSYLGISDHSQAAGYANGLKPDRVVAQHALIDQVNAMRPGLRVLKGSEVDILASGEVDFDAETRGQFDYLVESVHSRFNLSVEEMTARVLKAIEDPQVMVLGHPSGRLLQARDPYPLDYERVFAACAREGVAIELNANPHRLDLDWRHIRHARDLGVKFFINADAHSAPGLDDVALYGIGLARKGWLEATDIVNTRDLQGVLAFFSERRSRAAKLRPGRA